MTSLLPGLSLFLVSAQFTSIFAPRCQFAAILSILAHLSHDLFTLASFRGLFVLYSGESSNGRVIS